MTGSAHPAEAALEEGSLEEAAAPPMTQGNDPEAPQTLDSTDLDVPIEAAFSNSMDMPRNCYASGYLSCSIIKLSLSIVILRFCFL